MAAGYGNTRTLNRTLRTPVIPSRETRWYVSLGGWVGIPNSEFVLTGVLLVSWDAETWHEVAFCDDNNGLGVLGARLLAQTAAGARAAADQGPAAAQQRSHINFHSSPSYDHPTVIGESIFNRVPA